MPVIDPLLYDRTIFGLKLITHADDPFLMNGAVATVFYHSKTLGEERRMYVYTPPGYERGGTKTYPFLYLLTEVATATPPGRRSDWRTRSLTT